jgi:hypothetical protein
MSNENDVIEDILAFIDAGMPQKVVEQAIPNTKTVLRNTSGDIEVYIAVQFGDGQEGRTHSFNGPRGDDYIIPVYTQVVAPDPAIARRVAAKLRDLMLGASFTHAGQVRKRPGGGMFPIVTSNGATEAYQMPASFGVPIQFDSGM